MTIVGYTCIEKDDQYKLFIETNKIISNCTVIYPDNFNPSIMSFYEKFKFNNIYRRNKNLAFVYYLAINTIRTYAKNSYSFFDHSPTIHESQKVVIGGGYVFALNMSVLAVKASGLL